MKRSSIPVTVVVRADARRAGTGLSVLTPETVCALGVHETVG